MNKITAVLGTTEQKIANKTLTLDTVNTDGTINYTDLGIAGLWELYEMRLKEAAA